MAQDAAFSCTCGKIGGVLHDLAPKTGIHALCYCSSCRSAEIYLGQPDPEDRGVDLFQMSPEKVEFTRGKEHLGCLQLKEGNLMRWYATCCNAPLFNTMPNPKIAFASIHVPRLADPDAVGPVKGRVFVPKEGGGARHENLLGFMFGTSRRVLRGLVTGSWNRSPFLDPETRAYAVTPKVLTSEDRAALPLKA